VPQVLKQLRKLPWAEHERYVIKCLLKARGIFVGTDTSRALPHRHDELISRTSAASWICADTLTLVLYVIRPHF